MEKKRVVTKSSYTPVSSHLRVKVLPAGGDLIFSFERSFALWFLVRGVRIALASTAYYSKKKRSYKMKKTERMTSSLKSFFQFFSFYMNASSWNNKPLKRALFGLHERGTKARTIFRKKKLDLHPQVIL